MLLFFWPNDGIWPNRPLISIWLLCCVITSWSKNPWRTSPTGFPSTISATQLPRKDSSCVFRQLWQGTGSGGRSRSLLCDQKRVSIIKAEYYSPRESATVSIDNNKGQRWVRPENVDYQCSATYYYAQMYYKQLINTLQIDVCAYSQRTVLVSGDPKDFSGSSDLLFAQTAN